jgi:hypothetical protein
MIFFQRTNGFYRLCLLITNGFCYFRLLKTNGFNLFRLFIPNGFVIFVPELLIEEAWTKIFIAIILGGKMILRN